MKALLCILVMLTCQFCNVQNVTKCIVYQFYGNDSTKKHIALIRTFNIQGQVISETYSNYKKGSREANSDGTYHYYYTDTLLTKRLFIDDKKDTLKCLYYYNSLHQCIKQEYFSCERRLKKTVTREAVFDDDFEKNRTWMKANEVTFTYDGKGRTVKRTDQHDYTRLWRYDEQNRIIQEKGYSNDRVAFVKDYTYFNGGYKYSTIYYDPSGYPEQPEYSDIIFSPVYTFTFYLDEKGRVIKEEVTTEKGIKISSEATDYDHNDRIVKTVHRDIDKHFIRADIPPEVTHIFEYK